MTNNCYDFTQMWNLKQNEQIKAKTHSYTHNTEWWLPDVKEVDREEMGECGQLHGERW